MCVNIVKLLNKVKKRFLCLVFVFFGDCKKNMYYTQNIKKKNLPYQPEIQYEIKILVNINHNINYFTIYTYIIYIFVIQFIHKSNIYIALRH